MGKKLDHILGEYEVVIVYPVAVTTTLCKEGSKPRKSPVKGSLYTIFDELVSVPTLLDHPNFSLEIVLAHIDKIQTADPKMRRRRGGWRTTDKILKSIEGVERFNSVSELCVLVPSDLPNRFTTADLATRSGVSRDVAQKMAYCFKAAEVFEVTDRKKDGYIYKMV